MPEPEREASEPATLTLTRAWGGLLSGAKPWQVLVDGEAVAAIGARETLEVEVAPGRHTLRVTAGPRLMSRARGFEASPGMTSRFACHAARYWPLMLAALIKPDLWITLRPA